jgi:hypothetical protein
MAQKHGAHVGVPVRELDNSLGDDRPIIEQFRHPVAQGMLYRYGPGQWSQGRPDGIGHLIDAALHPQVRVGLKDDPSNTLFCHAVM